jgi:hypothetical protein
MMFRYCMPLMVLLAAPLAAQQTKPIDPANFDTTCAPRSSSTATWQWTRSR